MDKWKEGQFTAESVTGKGPVEPLVMCGARIRWNQWGIGEMAGVVVGLPTTEQFQGTVKVEITDVPKPYRHFIGKKLRIKVENII